MSYNTNKKIIKLIFFAFKSLKNRENYNINLGSKVIVNL